MIVKDATFLTENTEDREDLVANLEKYARENQTAVLLCVMEGLISINDETIIQETKDYFKSLLDEELSNVLLETKYAIIHFRSEEYAQHYAEHYFYKKPETENFPQKFVYNCVVSSTGSIDYENIKSYSTTPPTKFHENYTAEDIGNYEKLLEQFYSNQ